MQEQKLNDKVSKLQIKINKIDEQQHVKHIQL